MIVDTVDFEGLMIFDEVNSEHYLVKSEGLKKIRLTNKSNERFIKDFMRTEKMNFLSSYIKIHGIPYALCENLENEGSELLDAPNK